jgi:nitrogen-specific signal transduction histidine kinase
VRVAAWCWRSGSGQLTLHGCLTRRDAEQLAADVAERGLPAVLDAEGAAVDPAAATVLRAALGERFAPPSGPRAGDAPGTPAASGRAVHEIRNRLAVLRLRLQLLAASLPEAGNELAVALADVDSIASALGRLAAAGRSA